MIRKIIGGIIEAIRTEYGKPFRIYTESVEQGLKEPCFSVLCLEGSSEQHVGSRRNRTHPFNITYFPSSNDPIAECLAVMENLYDLLEIIDIGLAKLRGTDLNGNVVDGVLQFQVTYSAFLLVTKVGTSMEELEVKTDGNS